MTAPAGERPLCELPFLAGDPGHFTSWYRANRSGERCRNRATWAIRAQVERIIGSRFADRWVCPDVVEVYGCSTHPLLPLSVRTWSPTPGIVAVPLEGYELPKLLRPLRAPRVAARPAVRRAA